MFAAQTPLAEVLAVVAEEVIAVLADPGPRSPNHLFMVEANGTISSNPDRVCVSETRERNLFHRSAVEATYQSAVVDDSAAADVDTMVGKGNTRCNEV